MANLDFQLDARVATILAQIISHDNALPQGAPTSPVVSNLIGHILDVDLARLAKRMGCIYTRYADDLTFSTNKRAFPSDIAVASADNPHVWGVAPMLARTIARNGFALNEAKTRMHYCDSRQAVTGLVVNKKVNVRREYKALVRQMVRKLTTTGSFHLSRTKDANGNVIEHAGTIEQLGGMLSFIRAARTFTELRAANGRGAHHVNRADSFFSIHRDFLVYRDFHSNDRPVILFEGKTDGIYLRSALRRAPPGAFPSLMQRDGQKTFIRPRLFKASNLVGSLLGLNGGSGDLKNFFLLLEGVVRRFIAPASRHPVIFVVDNDGGLNPLLGIVRNRLGREPNRQQDQYWRLGDRIYIVPTPLGGANESCIEDCFDQQTLSIELGGKRFSRSTGFDTSRFYGKQVFANSVVSKREADIDFSGFDGLLAVIDGIVEAHA